MSAEEGALKAQNALRVKRLREYRKRKSTPLELDEINARNTLYMRNRRAEQTEEERAAVRARDAVRHRQHRAQQTEEERAAVRARNAVRHRQHRAEHTDQERTAERARNAAQHQQRYAQRKKEERAAEAAEGALQLEWDLRFAFIHIRLPRGNIRAKLARLAALTHEEIRAENHANVARLDAKLKAFYEEETAATQQLRALHTNKEQRVEAARRFSAFHPTTFLAGFDFTHAPPCRKRQDGRCAYCRTNDASALSSGNILRQQHEEGEHSKDTSLCVTHMMLPYLHILIPVRDYTRLYLPDLILYNL